MQKNKLKITEHEDTLVLVKKGLLDDTIHNNAQACDNVSRDGFDLEKAKKKSQSHLTALGANEGLQALLASQMLAIHKLQQRSMAIVNGLSYSEASQYYTNTSIKLANTFVQQATLLAKLQGGIGQKIIVERVDISHGGQAVIGNVNGGRIADKAKI
jgi:hypothetical protein